MINIETEKVAVENLMKAIEAAENRKDLTAMLGAMTDDAVLQVGGAPLLQGHAAIRQLYEGFFPVFVSTSITTLHTEVALSGDVAWQFGIHVNELIGPEGHVKRPGKWISIYTKVDGTWKMSAVSISDNS